MLSLPGYRLVEKLPDAGAIACYRGLRIADGVAVQLLAAAAGSEDAERLAREYAVAGGLDCRGVVRPLACEVHGAQTVLVRAECGGLAVGEAAPAGRMTVAAALRLAAAAAAVLDELHRRRIAHLGLTPETLRVDAAGRVFLTGFFQAAALPAPEGAPAPAHPAYMAPEQTGRTGFAVGPAADLYALGVILFQMLTGELPFRVGEPLEWHHAHLARAPLVPSGLKPTIPPAVDQIVARLLAKAPEDRYHSAGGLAWDLLDCASRLEAGGDWEGYRPGSHDAAPGLALPAHLYGREAERRTLFETWQRVAAGRAELLLVRGPAGVGKSALVHELVPAIAAAGGRFIAGKVDEHNRATPYSSLMQALQELVRQVLAESDERLAHWREKLGRTLGANARVICDALPQAELVLGAQPPLPALPPAETRTRFQRSLQDFIAAFAEMQRPLAIFLDDMQWIDTASLELLVRLLTDCDTRNLLVVGACRDDDAKAAAGPLEAATAQIAAAGVRVAATTLGALGESEVAALVATALDDADTGELAHLVMRRTDGNPLFVRQFLLNLCDRNLLAYDAELGRWRWNLQDIDAAEPGGDVAELMAQRLRRLSAAALRAVQIAACLGNRFNAATVAAVDGKPEAELFAVLAEAREAGAVVPLGEAGAGWFRFVHDRIQQTAYAMLPEDERVALHLAAGRALLARGEPQADTVYEIANQFQYGLGRIDEAAERRALLRVFMQAGAQAKAAAAFEAARSYLNGAARLDGDGLANSDAALALQLLSDRAECEFLCGNGEAAETLFGQALALAREAAQIVRLYVLRMDLQMSQGSQDLALATGRAGLLRLGIGLPAKVGKVTLLAGLVRIAAKLSGRRIEDLAELPAMTDADQRAVMRLYMNLTVPAYFVDRDMLAVITMRMVELSLRYGNAGASAYAYVVFGLLLGGGFGRYRDGFRFGEVGRRLAESGDDARIHSLLLSMCGIFTGAWGQPLAQSLAQLRRARTELVDCGNLMYANYAAVATLFALDASGEPLAGVAAEAQRLEKFVRKVGFAESAHYYLSAQRKILCLQGETAAPGSLAGDGYDEARQFAALRSANEQTMLAWHLLGRLEIAYRFGRLDAAKAAADELEAMREVSLAQIYVPRQWQFAALAEFALAAAAEGATRRRHLRAAGRYLRRLRPLAASAPFNYRHVELLLEAEQAAATDAGDAVGRYDLAVKAAAEAGHTSDWALANARAAANLLRQGAAAAAGPYLLDACRGYRRWGATALADALEREHPGLAEATTAGETVPGAAPIDMAAVMKASQAISGEIEFGGLLRRLMEALATHAGAVRVVFIMKRDAGLQIEDEWRAGDDAVQCAGPMPLEACRDIAHAVVQYAARTQSDVVLDDAARDRTFAGDAYLAAGSQKSVLCLPIVRHGALLGLIYMENPLLRGAFHHERLRVLHLLGAQLAISIENVTLYERLKRASLNLEEANRGLEEKVAARTRELSDEIAERRRIEVRLREATEAAEAASKAKSAFLANMSHEIRTPMNAIIGLSQLALRTELTSRQYGYLKKIDGAAELLLGLINDILDMSKIEAGKMSLEAIPFSVDEVVNRVADTIEMAAHEKGLELVVHCTRRIPCRMIGDPLRLGQVLLNLASNAVKFTASGEIALKVEREHFDEESGHIVLRFAVSDSGIGIGTDQIARLFQPFSQADMSVTRTYGGTGLGLTIVKELVQMMGGTVEVASKPGEGSTFAFTARFGVAPVEATAEAAGTVPEYAGLRVLIVDDNATARAALQHILEAAGSRVTTVTDGAAAIAELQAAGADDPYRLVLMDWYMPGLDGVETTRRIKDDPAIGRQPVVVMVTAFSREDVEARVARLATSVDAYLLKPVKPATLLNTIARIFGFEEGAPVAAAPQPAPQARHFAGLSLLVVEDNAYNQLVARELLEGAGFRVDIAENGRIAVDRVLGGETRYDAVLMDVQMPVMDGWAATRELRRHERCRDLPIVGMTAYTMTEDIERCRAAGMNDVVTKPVRIDRLLEVLGVRLPARPTNRAAAARERDDVVMDDAAAVARLGGNRDLLLRLAADFHSREGNTVERLSELLAAGSLEEAVRLAHSVKGTALILGLQRFAAVAAKVEQALRSDGPAAAEPLLPAFAAELAEAIDACGRLTGAPVAPATAAARRAAPVAAPLPAREVLLPVAEEFAVLVERSHMGALKLLPRLRELLDDTSADATVAEIAASLERLDFKAARSHAARIAAIARGGE